MNGRLEHDLKVEAKIKAVLDTCPDYVTEWDVNLRASQKSSTTRYNYVGIVAYYLKSINSNTKDIQLTDLTIVSVQRFFIQIQTRTVNNKIVETSDSYKCTNWFALNSFFRYLLKVKKIDDNPVTLIDRPTNHDLDRINQSRKLLTEKDFDRIIIAVDNDFDCMFELIDRNKLMLLLFMTTGMRKTALSEINLNDIDENYKLTIIDKRKKTHTYTLTDTIIECLEDWKVARQTYLNKLGIDSDALFISKYGNRVSTDAIDEVVKRYSKKALGYSISPHKLRAGCTSILYNKTHDIEYVRRAIGHSSVETTQRYIVTNGNERDDAIKMLSDIFS